MESAGKLILSPGDARGQVCGDHGPDHVEPGSDRRIKPVFRQGEYPGQERRDQHSCAFEDKVADRIPRPRLQ